MPALFRIVPVLVALLALLPSCDGDDPQPSVDAFDDWPEHFPQPRLPEDYPMTLEAVELGRHLFYDERLSLNETQSCSSCHIQSLAFTDGLAQAVGSTGEFHPRSAMALVNLAWAPRLNWANPLINTLEAQALGPIFGEEPIELGMAGREELLLQRLRDDPAMLQRFEAAFPDEEPVVSLVTVTRALASFQRTLISADAPYDRYFQGDESAMSDAALRGMQLFFSEELECFHCHGGTLFTDSVDHSGLPEAETPYHNTGLYNIGGDGAYPAGNQGVRDISGEIRDMGRFRAPTLRNIEVTSPYFHDGSALTLRDVVAHYASGGRTITEGPNAGVGSENPFKSQFVSGFTITEDEINDLIAFLESLTDTTFLTNPRFSDPEPTAP